MPWIPVVLLVVTVGVAIAAWWLRRRLGPSLNRSEPREDAVDSWLIKHYRLLSWADRHEAREAVRRGRAVRDPALRVAASALAAELLSGRLRDRQPWTLALAGFYALGGALWAGTGLARHGTAASVGVLLGVGWLLVAVTWAWNWRRLPRRTVRRALQLNGSEPAPGDAGR